MTQANDISTQDRINYFNELNQLLTTLNMVTANGGSSMDITSSELAL
jgi:hypothetical protein